MRRPELFRRARESSVSWNLFKTTVQIFLFWTTFLVMLPVSIVWIESATGLGSCWTASRISTTLGWALFVMFSSLGLTSAAVMATSGEGTPLPFDCPRRLVVRGPFRYVRNPMAIAGIGQGIAMGIVLASLAVVAYAIAGAMFWHCLVRPAEEIDLSRRFGVEYDSYRGAVPLWFPGLTAYRSNPAE